MTWWEGILLGAVQGLTEFLPVSSSGHLVIVETALGLQTPGVVVEVALHAATLAAVLIVYARRVGALARGAVMGHRPAWRSLGLLALATVPAGAIGYFLNDFFETTFHSLTVVGVDLLITGVVLWLVGRAPGGNRPEPRTAGALGIGLAQAVAILPGISRSGTTVAAGIYAGVEPAHAAEFSFLMAVPVIAGAAVLKLPELGAGARAVWGLPLLLSFVTALVTGILAIRLLVRMLARRSFHRFAPYYWVVGAATLAWSLLRP